ncbi:hypothetical protein L6452_02384 [Arctium lappa]|uniref:Uncharacterized protein n=1 Tax=Arctium lappa TaxID=4217 RepID=A0ACB9FJ93_ARCLA|nr:hypothetical protein L6452_02384 [Arctium lappa]
MKRHKAKMPRMEDILNLPVQDPSGSELSAAHLDWAKVEGGRQGGNDIALIPFARVNDFVKGESTNAECLASFRIESRRKRPEGSVIKPRVDGYLEYTLYWCSYGPEDYRDIDAGLLDSLNNKPASGKGSRPGRRHMMRGCLCHFTVKRLYTRPHVALIIYNQQNHVDSMGAPCHGILDQNAVGTRAMYAPRISEELRQKVMSMLYVGISVDNIIQHHLDEVQRHGGPQSRDDFLTRNDIRNMERHIRSSSHEFNTNDEASVKMWVQRHHKNFCFFQEKSSSEPFVLGIQTDWQLQQMIRYGHHSSIAFHSTFGYKQFKYPLCSLLVFDTSQNAIPVAWIITSCSVGQSVNKWIGSISERIRSRDPRWKPSAVLVDDPCFEPSIIREAFQCQVLLCLWRVRHGLVKRLVKSCCNFDVQHQILKHAGHIIYGSRGDLHTFDAVEAFMQIYVDQVVFMDYFRDHWLPTIEMWVNSVRTLPVASQEPYAAIESYHLQLKSRILTPLHAGSWPRVDWVIHILTTEFHSLYWFNQYVEEMRYFGNLKEESHAPNSWYQAMYIPDVDVLLDEQNLQLAKVVSQEDRSLVYTVWNPGSEFSLCDCPASRLGNLCKHAVKVAMVCKLRKVGKPLLAAQVYRQALLNLLHNPPDDPVVLDHANLHISRLQQDIKGLEDLSRGGLLRPLPPETNS